MKYSLRSLMIGLATLPPAFAVTWWAVGIQWSEEVVLLVALACAIPYWAGIIAVLARNPSQPVAWMVGIGGATLFPVLFFMSFLQLAVVIPVWTVLLCHGTNLATPLTRRTVALALGLTIGFFLWLGCITLVHDSL